MPNFARRDYRLIAKLFAGLIKENESATSGDAEFENGRETMLEDVVDRFAIMFMNDSPDFDSSGWNEFIEFMGDMSPEEVKDE